MCRERKRSVMGNAWRREGRNGRGERVRGRGGECIENWNRKRATNNNILLLLNVGYDLLKKEELVCYSVQFPKGKRAKFRFDVNTFRFSSPLPPHGFQLPSRADN